VKACSQQTPPCDPTCTPTGGQTCIKYTLRSNSAVSRSFYLTLEHIGSNFEPLNRKIRGEQSYVYSLYLSLEYCCRNPPRSHNLKEQNFVVEFLKTHNNNIFTLQLLIESELYNVHYFSSYLHDKHLFLLQFCC
jgi:hypothetical protein